MGALRTFGLLAVTATMLAAPGGGAASNEVMTSVHAIVAPANVLALGLTGRNVVFAVDETRTECPHVELWLAASNARHRFRTTIGCKGGLSTGFGLPSVAVAGTRVLWLSFAGGNTREWGLWTATPTKSRPRLLRLVGQDADAPDPPPVVIGPGTARGVPYAVDREIVYLGAKGNAIFKTTVASPVRALAAGPGPGRLEVVALLADGWVVGLDGAGREYTAEPHAPGAVTAVRVSGSGIAVQVGDEVEITPPRSHQGTIVRLPPGAAMVDVTQSRILYSLRGDLWTVRIATGARTRLVDGSPTRPVLGQIDEHGVAWARARKVGWRPGAPP